MKKYENRIVVVTRETRLTKVLEAQNTLSQAKFYINRLGGDFDEYQTEHTHYGNSVQEARRSLEELAGIQLLDRRYLSNFIFAPNDIVVVIGQDGLVVNTIKYLDNQPLIGVNPDPARWDGVLLPFTPAEAAKIVEETLAGKRKIEEVSMARAKVQNGQELLAVNDFFIGQKGHASARYILKYGGVKEPQSSSGVIISTGLGSTGWMKSILAGASGISNRVIGRPFGAAQESDSLAEEYDEAEDESMAEITAPVETAAPKSPALNFLKKTAKLSKSKKTYGPSELSGVIGKWASKELIFAVREPFPSKSTGSSLVFGTLPPGESIRIESLMGENGVIFSDGIENDFISFNSGAEAVISLAEKKGRMVV